MKPAPLTPPELIPATIGPYPVVRVVAHGGMAVVYEVTDPESGRPLAVKVLQSRGAGAPRFGREYRALTRIDHPNVVRVYRYGINEQGLPYLVMELLTGQAAQVRVKAVGRPGDPVRTAEAIRIAFHVAEALQCLHMRGIIHRDLKSSNIIALPDGTVKLLDFGTARMENLRDVLTEPGEFVGTFHYASPEQLTGGKVDARTDLYALGVLLYRMLTGRRPFEGDDAVTLARQHLEHQPVSVDQLARGVPAAICELVSRLLAKSPASRPANASQVVEFLRPFVVGPPRQTDDPLPPLRFVGRYGHLAAVRRLFDEALPGAGLVFCGPEGAGRGRLVGFAVDEATRRGSRSLRLIASGTAQPFAPVCTQLAAGLLLDGDPVGAAWGRAALNPGGLHAVSFAEALAARARLDRHLLLLAVEGMEDALPADVRTLAATMVALAEIGGNVILVGAWGEEALPATWLGLHLMDVPPLTGLEVGVVASHWLGVSAVPPELVRRLTAASGGMPSPLERIVRLLPRDGRERPVPPVVSRAHDALIMRIESLLAPQRRVLETLALAEGDLDLDVIAAAVDLPLPVVRELLAELTRERIIEPARLPLRPSPAPLETPPSSWVFRQGITAEFLREHTRPTRRALLCRRIAGALPDPPPSQQLPLVLLDADRPEAAARSVVAWARPLVELGMYAEALQGLEKVVHGRANAPADFSLWRLYAECLAVLRSASMQTDQALAQARSLAEGPVQEGELALVAAGVARARGDTPAERASLVRAIETFRRAGGAVYASFGADALARFSELLACIGEFDVAWRLAREGMDARAPAADPAGVGRSRTALALVELCRGEIVSAERLFLETVQTDGSDWRAISGLGTALRLQGRLSEARRVLEEALARARIHAPAPLLAALLVTAAQLDIDLFRAGLARDRILQAMDALQGDVPALLDAPIALLRARLLDLSGDALGGLQTVEFAVGRAEARGWRLHAAELTAQRGALLGRLGREGEALVTTAAAVRCLVRMGAITALSEVFVGAVDRGGAVDPLLRGEIDQWVERQPVRIARLALLTDETRHAQIEGGLDPEISRNRAHTLLRQLTQMQVVEDRASFLLHPRRQNLRGH